MEFKNVDQIKISRKVNDEEYIHKLLDLKTNAQLKQICRDYGVRGFSKFGKSGLVNFVHNSLTDEQLEKVFEIPVKKIYSKAIKPSLDWKLGKIYEIIKTMEPVLIPYGDPIDIEKNVFKQVDLRGHIEGKRLDFTILFTSKLFQPLTIINNDETNITNDYTIILRKEDFISVLKEDQNGIILHQIYKLNYGDFPRNSSLEYLNDWLILADLNYKEGYYYEAISLYEMLLSEFELSDEIRAKVSKKREKAKKLSKKKIMEEK